MLQLVQASLGRVIPRVREVSKDAGCLAQTLRWLLQVAAVYEAHHHEDKGCGECGIEVKVAKQRWEGSECVRYARQEKN